MAVQYNWRVNGLHRVYTGMTSGEEVFNSNLVIQGDPRFAGIKYVINDFTSIDEFIIGKGDLLNIAAVDNMAAIEKFTGKSHPALKIAIVAVFEPLLEWIHLYIEMMRDSVCECRFFENIDDAHDWVNDTA